MEFLLALQFLTRVPVNIKGQVEERYLSRSMAYYPLVGLLLGLGAALFYYVISKLTNNAVGDVLVIAFVVVVTGNMHLDGLMDTADGIFSGKPPEGILEVMKDSRVGAHGVAAGVLAILTRYTLLSHLPSGTYKLIALVITPLMGRWIQVYGAALYPYARSSGGKSNFIEQVGRRELLWATIISVFSLFLFFGLYFNAARGMALGSLFAVVIFAGAVLVPGYLARKINGITGDLLGAATELTELWALLIFLILKH